MVAYKNYVLPKDTEAMAKVYKQIEDLVPEIGSEDIGDGGFRGRMFSGTFGNRDAEQLRHVYLGLNSFQESWIPLIKSGSYGDFELYDLDKDPRQQTDVAAQRPDVVARLKKILLEINASVVADAPNWK